MAALPGRGFDSRQLHERLLPTTPPKEWSGTLHQALFCTLNYFVYSEKVFMNWTLSYSAGLIRVPMASFPLKSSIPA